MSMEVYEKSSSESFLTVEIAEEIFALKAIYDDDEITTEFVDEDTLNVTFSTEGFFINFLITRNYPNEPPNLKVYLSGNYSVDVTTALEKRSNEESGELMLYKLITTATDLLKSKHLEYVFPEQKTICKYFMEGKCKFGSKCFNWHPNSMLENCDQGEASEIKNEKRADVKVLESADHNRKEQKKSKSKHSHEYLDDATFINSKREYHDSAVDILEHNNSNDEYICKEKKSRMKTAIDVINRIIWDDALPTENFVVGYLDRFLGVQEKGFLEFSWEDIASVDYTVLAIPKHRIQYFKYKDVVVWDKNKRLDKVFGSTGDGSLITDIINDRCDVDTEIIKRGEEENIGSPTHGDYNRPNFFMCLRITDEEVKENAIKLQNHILSHDGRLKETLMDSNVFHVTLITMRLNNESDHIKANNVLKSLERLLVCMLPINTLLSFQGVNNFRSRAIYVDIQQNPLFEMFVEAAELKLKDAGIRLVGNYKPFKPHLTIMKLGRSFCREVGMESVNSDYYSKYNDFYFGKQPIYEVRICSIVDDFGADNFYSSLATIYNNPFSIWSKLTSLISIRINDLVHSGEISQENANEYSDKIVSNTFSQPDKLELYFQNLFISAPKGIKHVIIMRGLPGSGKSYIAKRFQENCGDLTVGMCSSDESIKSYNFAYMFDGKEIASAHINCQNKFIDLISENADVVVVDNCHMQRWEYSFYERIANLCGYSIHIIEISCRKEAIREAFYQRCSHSISPCKHLQMHKKWEVDTRAMLISGDSSVNLNDIIEDEHIGQINISSVLHVALYLDEASQEQLLSSYPPIHECVQGQYISLVNEPTYRELGNLPIGAKRKAKVTGYVVNNFVQCLKVELMGCQFSNLAKHFVSISVTPSTTSADVSHWIGYQPSIPAKCEIVLSGVVGVEFTSNDGSSDKYIDPSLISRLYPFESDDSLSNASYEEPCSSSEETSSICRQLYLLPRIIKSLFVFDFDGTLFHTPNSAVGKKEYLRATSCKWPFGGWLSRSESLQHPLHVYPGPSLRDYFQHCGQACSMTVLLTGRMEGVRYGLESVLASRGLNFERVIMKPNGNFSNVHGHKKCAIKSLMSELPNLELVKFWDDREDNIKTVQSLKKTIQDVRIDVFHVNSILPPLERLSISDLLDRMGIRPSNEFKVSVREGLDFISTVWKDLIGDLSDKNCIFPCGSYLLERKGDVDICILAPRSRSVDYYIRKLGEQLKDRGVKYVYVATGTRCPRIRLKLEYIASAPVEYDITIALAVDDGGIPEEIDFRKLFKTLRDKKSKTAVEGVLFHENVVAPVLDRVNAHDFGVVIDVINTVLKRYHLKGNPFHCIRTFHVVKMLADFIALRTCNFPLPIEGWHTLKEFQTFFHSFLIYLSEKSNEGFSKVFKGFVQTAYVKRLRKCFLESSERQIIDILFSAPTASPINVAIELRGSDSAQIWTGMCIAEARLSNFTLKLMDIGADLHPVYTTSNTIAFKALPLDVCMPILKQFKYDLQPNLPLGVTVEVFFYEV